MSTTITRKGQVTIPKKIRQTLHLAPGSRVEFALDEAGRIVIRKVDAEPSSGTSVSHDRFERARGRATVKWTTAELMQLLRGKG